MYSLPTSSILSPDTQGVTGTMASKKTILLNTSTVNFLELLGNGRRYQVPPYQRDYSWQEEQWEDLWNDLLEMLHKPEERPYMGALVVEVLDDREFLIIDGQQRIATLSILALAVLARLREFAAAGEESEDNLQRAEVLRSQFIGMKDPASLLESSKLNLNENDNGFYQDYLVQLRAPLNPRGLSRSNRLLWECFRYFKDKIIAQQTALPTGKSLASLLNETVARQLLFILITVDDDLNAYTVFETLNARGLELSSTDLLKNYLFSRVRVGSDLEALQRRWKKLLNTVRQERFPEFLRYHLLCEEPKIRSQRLFKLVRDKVRSADDVFDIMIALESRAELFSAIFDPNHEYWIERRECRNYLRKINLFRVRQMTPLLFAAWEKFDEKNFERILKLVSVISFRYSIISSLNTNELEPVYHYAAKAVLSGEAKGPAEVFTKLKSVYVDDERMRQDFARLQMSTRGTSRKLAKYILCRLEADLSNKPCDHETDTSSIEHILPENPGSEWEETIPAERWEEAAYRLGNLTLLEPGLNRNFGNSPYLHKVDTYANSGYVLNQQIAQYAPEAWTLDHIEARQERMAARAVHLWRADFA